MPTQPKTVCHFNWNMQGKSYNLPYLASEM